MEAEFAREILTRVPLAEAVLSLWRWVADPLFLLSVFVRHRGAGYEKDISLGVLVQRVADALLEHHGSGRKSFERGREQGLLTATPQAVYQSADRAAVCSPALREVPARAADDVTGDRVDATLAQSASQETQSARGATRHPGQSDLGLPPRHSISPTKSDTFSLMTFTAVACRVHRTGEGTARGNSRLSSPVVAMQAGSQERMAGFSHPGQEGGPGRVIAPRQGGSGEVVRATDIPPIRRDLPDELQTRGGLQRGRPTVCTGGIEARLFVLLGRPALAV